MLDAFGPDKSYFVQSTQINITIFFNIRTLISLSFNFSCSRSAPGSNESIFPPNLSVHRVKTARHFETLVIFKRKNSI